MLVVQNKNVLLLNNRLHRARLSSITWQRHLFIFLLTADKHERLVRCGTSGGARRRVSKINKIVMQVCESIVTAVESEQHDESLVDAAVAARRKRRPKHGKKPKRWAVLYSYWPEIEHEVRHGTDKLADTANVVLNVKNFVASTHWNEIVICLMYLKYWNLFYLKCNTICLFSEV